MAERISDKMSALLPRREDGRHNTDRRENSGKTPKSLQNRAFLRAQSAIVTLWQQWGKNIQFASRFTLRNARFRGRRPVWKADS
ncbi:hypothetical protein [Mesorhizobium sp. M1365]|uniref:hypothetical protein n=1 Tax=Mesorhizobium sp. M1365 TaxID=2957090 RepID=UPI0033385E79